MLTNRLAIAMTSLALAIGGVLSSFAFGASSSESIPTFNVTLTPNWVSQLDSASLNYQNLWIYGKSPTTPYRSPDSQHHVQRYLLLDPRVTDSDGHRGSDEWWFVIQRYWPSSYPAQNHGDWGTEVNFHNVAGDAGPDGGVGWGFGTGVSSLALCWPSNDPTPVMNVEPNQPQNELPLPNPSRDAWHTYVVHFVAGRTDGSTMRPGAITVWADGGASPVIDKTGINTVQRARANDGRSYTQQWMQLWEGDYTRNLASQSTVRLALTRIGTTLGAALADRPTVDATNASGQYYVGSGTNAGAPSITDAGGIAASAAAVPASLGGGGPTAAGAPATPTTTSAATTPVVTAPLATPTGSSRAGQPTRTGTGGMKTDDISSVSPAPVVYWGGRPFADWGDLRSYLSRRGVQLNRFLVNHPTVARRLGLKPLPWDGKSFYVRARFAVWLKAHGMSTRSWSKQHPGQLERLA
jgi:hypothetical protein